ncbi:MAG: MOSC domain-containing protein [Bdellovibrionales bacterium]
MNCKILSLNVGQPEEMVWEDKRIVSSMRKSPIAGPLIVGMTSVEGDGFSNARLHGTPDSVLYAYGMSSVLHFLQKIGRSSYEPGALGENLTVDELNEDEVSVGDEFQIGEVLAQATFPRIPCGKVNIRIKHPDARETMANNHRTGVYFRILRPGRIERGSSFERTKLAQVRFSILEACRLEISRALPSADQLERIRLNGAFPKLFLEKLPALREGRNGDSLAQPSP